MPSSPPDVAPGMRVLGDGRAVLAAHRCAACGVIDLPASTLCGYCGSDRAVALEVGGRGGTLFGWTTVTAPPPGYAGPVPYGFGIVELDEGVRVLGRLTVAAAEVADGAVALRFGQRMEVVTAEVPREDAAPLVVWAFAPAGEPS